MIFNCMVGVFENIQSQKIFCKNQQRGEQVGGLMETWKCTSKGKGHLNATYFLCDFKIKCIFDKNGNRVLQEKR